MTGLWVPSGTGVNIHDVHGEFRLAGHQHPLDECGEALSRTVPGQLLSCGGVQSSYIKRAKAAVRVARVSRQENEILGVVLKRAVPLLQQEDEDCRIIHKSKIKTGNKMRGKTPLYFTFFGWLFCHGFSAVHTQESHEDED